MRYTQYANIPKRDWLTENLNNNVKIQTINMLKCVFVSHNINIHTISIKSEQVQLLVRCDDWWSLITFDLFENRQSR